jgi:hypothetical protein
MTLPPLPYLIGGGALATAVLAFVIYKIVESRKAAAAAAAAAALAAQQQAATPEQAVAQASAPPPVSTMKIIVPVKAPVAPPAPTVSIMQYQALQQQLAALQATYALLKTQYTLCQAGFKTQKPAPPPPGPVTPKQYGIFGQPNTVPLAQYQALQKQLGTLQAQYTVLVAQYTLCELSPAASTSNTPSGGASASVSFSV